MEDQDQTQPLGGNTRDGPGPRPAWAVEGRPRSHWLSAEDIRLPAAVPKGDIQRGSCKYRKGHTNRAGLAHPLQPELGSGSLEEGLLQGKEVLNPGWA